MLVLVLMLSVSTFAFTHSAEAKVMPKVLKNSDVAAKAPSLKINNKQKSTEDKIFPVIKSVTKF